MLSVPCRYFNLRLLNNGFIGLSSNSNASAQPRNYSKDKSECCKYIAQTEDQRVEPWPKAPPPPGAWRSQCPSDPQPPNYDPYRIKVPNVVVPPLPPSTAKEIPDEDSRYLFKDAQPELGSMSREMVDLFRKSAIVHPDYWKDKSGRKLNKINRDNKYISVKLGYHGKNKYKYAFHEPWKPLDRLSLLAQAEKEELELPENIAGSEK